MFMKSRGWLETMRLEHTGSIWAWETSTWLLCNPMGMEEIVRERFRGDLP